MRQHHAFWFARRAGRVNDRREIIRLGVRNSTIDVTGFPLFKFASLFFDLGQRQTFRICDSFRIEENDVLYLRTLTERVSQLQMSVPGESLDYYVFYGPEPKDVLTKYTKLSGRPALPPSSAPHRCPRCPRTTRPIRHATSIQLLLRQGQKSPRRPAS